jgi:hypothetical protein
MPGVSSLFAHIFSAKLNSINQLEQRCLIADQLHHTPNVSSTAPAQYNAFGQLPDHASLTARTA